MCEDDIVRGRGPAVTLSHEVDEDSPLDSVMLHELLRREHTEILWSRWRVAESRIEPTWLDPVLPDDARVLFRITNIRDQYQEVLLEVGDCLVRIERRPSDVWVRVAASDPASAEAALARLRELLPEPVEADGTRVGMVFWHVTGHGPRSDHRSLEALEWKEVERNYPRATRERLEGLMRAFVPGEGGRLLLWHGAPGTGKTSAVRALAWEWREWCEVDCLVRPES